MARDELSGWKQISDYLGTSVRTAQRYEQDLGLPVHRMPAPASGVIADRDELDAWKAATVASAERREAMERAEQELPADAWAANGQAAPAVTAAAGAASGPGAVPEPCSPVLTPLGRPVRRRHPATLPALVLVASTVAALVLWALSTGSPDAAPGEPPGATAHAAAAPAPPIASPVLDPGPWPTDGHDMQRTNRSHLRGPRAPGAARQIYDIPASGPVWDALTATIDGRLTLGACSFVVSIDGTGRELWKREIRAVNGYPVRPGGFAASADGVTFFTAVDCVGDADIVQSYLRVVDAEGTLSVIHDIGSSWHAPALGPNRMIYTIDEVNFVRGFRRPQDPVWGTTLASFSSGGIALDPDGNLLIGTDGGVTHQPSLWSLTPDGDVRWSALRDELGLVTVAIDRLYVVSMTGWAYAFDFEGRQLWATELGSVGSLRPHALGRSGTLYVQTSKEIVALGRDGVILWRFGPVAPHVPGAARPLLDRDENLYAAVRNEIVSLTPEGKERWRIPIPRPQNLIVGGEGVLYVTTTDGKIYEVR